MLLEEEEEKVKDDEQGKRAEEEVEDGADLLSTQEDNTHYQYLGKEREVLEQDHHRIQMPIHFVENETVEMVSTNDGIILIGRIPNEILEKILSEALLSSGFSWPNHVCRMYNTAMSSQRPLLPFHVLAYVQLMQLYKRRYYFTIILFSYSTRYLLVEISQSKPLFQNCTILDSCSQYQLDGPSTLLLIQDVPASCFPVSSPLKPHGNKPFLHPQEMLVYFKFGSLFKSTGPFD